MKLYLKTIILPISGTGAVVSGLDVVVISRIKYRWYLLYDKEVVIELKKSNLCFLKINRFKEAKNEGIT